MSLSFQTHLRILTGSVNWGVLGSPGCAGPRARHNAVTEGLKAVTERCPSSAGKARASLPGVHCQVLTYLIFALLLRGCQWRLYVTAQASDSGRRTGPGRKKIITMVRPGKKENYYNGEHAILRVLKPGRGNSLVRVHHRNTSLPSRRCITVTGIIVTFRALRVRLP